MFKVRVEVSVMLEIDVESENADTAEVAAECIADDVITQWVHEELDSDNDIYAASWGVYCTEVEEGEYE